MDSRVDIDCEGRGCIFFARSMAGMLCYLLTVGALKEGRRVFSVYMR